MRKTIAAVAVLFGFVVVAFGANARAPMRDRTDIAPQRLASALTLFAKQRGVQVVFRSDTVDDKQTGGAVGDLTVEEALTQLLKGTGLTFRYLGDDAITIVPLSAPGGAGAGAPGRPGKAAQAGSSGAGQEGIRNGQTDRRNRTPPAREAAASGAGQPSEEIPGVAAHQNEEPATDADGAALQQVLVTARKRGEESMQRIPAAISVIGADSLEKMGVTNFSDFAYQIPGLSFTDNGPGAKRYIIRGVQSAGQEQVAVYYDEVPMSGIQSETSDSGSQTPDLKIYDMNRIEVLKGPQGTTFGANSQTGAVRFITNKPDLNDFEASYRGIGSQTSGVQPSADSASGLNWGGFAMLNMPIISDHLAARLVAYASRDAGYIDDVRLKLNDANWVQARGVRGMLRWRPMQQLTIDLMAWGQRQDTGSSFAYMPFDTIFNDGLTRQQKVALSTDQGGRDNISALARFQPGKFVSGTYVQTPIPDSQSIYSFTANWEFPVAMLTAAASRYERTLGLLQDSSFMLFSLGVRPAAGTDPGVRPDLFPAVTDQTQSLAQNAVEVRLSSTWSGPLQYLVGGFWRDRKSRFRSFISVADPDTGLRFDPGISPGAIVAPNPGAGIVDCLPCVFARINNRDVQEDAVFGELTYDIVPRLEATAGVRWFRVQQSDVGRTVFPFALFPPTPQLPDIRAYNEHKIIKKFGLSFHLTDDILLYTVASQGFRLGGTNQQGLVAVPPFYGSDSVWDYEIGLKSQWLGRRIALNTAAFRLDWDNLQIAGRDPTGAFGFIGNAGKAAITGLEAELFARPAERVKFTLGASWLPQRELTQDQVSNVIVAPGRKGDRIPRIPGLTANVSGQYSFPLAATGWSGWVGGEWSYKSGSSTEFRPFQVLGPNNVVSPNERYQRGFDITNLRLGARSTALDLDVTLFAENVFNVQGDVDIFVVGAQPTRKITNQPRTIGVQVDKRF